MIESLAAFERGLHKDTQVLFDLRLADVLGKLRRAKRRLEFRLLGRQVFVADIYGGDVGHWNNRPLLYNARISIENATVQWRTSPSQMVPLRYEIHPRNTPAKMAAIASGNGFWKWIIMYGTVIAR